MNVGDIIICESGRNPDARFEMRYDGEGAPYKVGGISLAEGFSTEYLKRPQITATERCCNYCRRLLRATKTKTGLTLLRCPTSGCDVQWWGKPTSTPANALTRGARSAVYKSMKDCGESLIEHFEGTDLPAWRELKKYTLGQLNLAECQSILQEVEAWKFNRNKNSYEQTTAKYVAAIHLAAKRAAGQAYGATKGEEPPEGGAEPPRRTFELD